MRVPVEKGQDDSWQRHCTVGKAILCPKESKVSPSPGGMTRERCVMSQRAVNISDMSWGFSVPQDGLPEEQRRRELGNPSVVS